jgi:hypothetical protein
MVCLSPKAPCRHPTKPSRPIVSRSPQGSRLLGILSPPSEKGSSPPADLFFCPRPGIFSPARRGHSHRAPLPLSIRRLRMDFGEVPSGLSRRVEDSRAGEAPGEGHRAQWSSCSTISVVNYLLKVGDHTTPPRDDISLTSRLGAVRGDCLARSARAPGSARAHRASRPLITPSADLRPLDPTDAAGAD